MDHLDQLENRSVHILREAYANFKNLGMLWSIGKDRPPLTDYSTWTKPEMKLQAEELRVKVDNDARKDAIQTVLGIAFLFTFAGTAATVIQGWVKIEADRP